ncbi:MAG: class I SAM-dependent methyltransferase [Candidatus Thorarchaeota archaeon]|nr:MAG: hypothetical protein DRO87_06025 [Candidatus Thorarchaeota archaeon]
MVVLSHTLPEQRNSSEDGQSIDYDEVSLSYDEVRGADSQMVRILLDEAILDRNSIVIDIGCGTANNTLILQALISPRVVGIDLSLGMLRQAHGKSDSIQCVHCPAEVLPFGKSVFDLAFMTEVIHHLTDYALTLSEAHRVLRSNGRMCIVTQSHRQIEERMTSRFFPSTIAIDQARYPSIRHIEETLRSTGFSDVCSSGHMFAPVRLGQDFLETVSNRGYSMLRLIDQSEFDEGLARLRDAISAQEDLSYSAGYSFIWATK